MEHATRGVLEEVENAVLYGYYRQMTVTGLECSFDLDNGIGMACGFVIQMASCDEKDRLT